MQVSDHKWKQRVEILGSRPDDAGSFTFTMVQRVGGHFDGVWSVLNLLMYAHHLHDLSSMGLTVQRY